MKKPKKSTAKQTTKQAAKRKTASTKTATKQSGTLKTDPNQDFGGLKIKRKSSSDESRKNVNGDPNLIQGNEWEEKDSEV